MRPSAAPAQRFMDPPSPPGCLHPCPEQRPILILDFDGTLTVIDGYAEQFAQEISWTLPAIGTSDEVLAALQARMSALTADPERTISIVPGLPAGRAGADPLLAAQVAAGELINASPEAVAILCQRYRLRPLKRPESIQLQSCFVGLG